MMTNSRPLLVPVRLLRLALQVEYPHRLPLPAVASTASSPLHRSRCSGDRLLLVQEACRCSSLVCSSLVCSNPV